ncbi:MAG: hypothetical protein DRJ03_28390 [Chloroflexi bacterium]|nr:MAG: hypothetical protein DRJ03_28390 [Chloroflexota bacterium]
MRLAPLRKRQQLRVMAQAFVVASPLSEPRKVCVLSFAVQELYALVKCHSHHSQLIVRRPGLEQSLFGGQGILARSQWPTIESIWQLAQGFLVRLGVEACKTRMKALRIGDSSLSIACKWHSASTLLWAHIS